MPLLKGQYSFSNKIESGMVYQNIEGRKQESRNTKNTIINQTIIISAKRVAQNTQY